MTVVWQRGSKHHDEYRWLAVPLRRGTYCLGRIVGKDGLAYFFPPELAELPAVKHVASLGPRDAFTMASFSLLGVENDGWPVLVGHDLDAGPWPLVEVETRADPHPREASRFVDDGRPYLGARYVGKVPKDQYGLRPENSGHGAQSLQGLLGGALHAIGRDGFVPGQFYDPLEQIGATYPLERVGPPPARPDRLVLVRIPHRATDPVGEGNQAAAGDWCDRLDDLFAGDPGVDVDGWEVGDDDRISVYVYGVDAQGVVDRLRSQPTLLPPGSSATIDPHGGKGAEIQLS